MKISIIIPALNEEENLRQLLPYLQKHSSGQIREIIVADGGSSDRTIEISEKLGATVVHSPKKGRAFQMNLGAEKADSCILYFLHADSIPPANFVLEIINHIKNGACSGCFTLRFDDPNPFLKFYAVFTSLKTTFVRFGDQSLFVNSKIFRESGGFNNDLIVMEDQEIVHRLKQAGRFVIIKNPVVTSSRKYRKFGVLKLQFIFTIIYLLYYLGARQETLVHLYKNLIRSE